MLSLLCALSLQAPPEAWIPARAAAPSRAPAAEEDGAYLEAVAALARADAWSWDQIEALRPANAARAELLASWFRQADVRQRKLGALLGAGSGGVLAHELLRVGVQCADESLGVACLLAPAAPAAEWWPALAHAALTRQNPLPLRAAATARLLEAGCWAAWPIARSILRSGTALDEPAPWADWTRAGRYELPKRLIVSSLDLRLAQAGAEACGFEPNAPWSAQVECLRQLEPRVQALKRSSAAPAVLQLAPWRALVRGAGAGDPQAMAVLSLLSDEALPLLRAALAEGDAGRTWATRRALEERPR